MDQSDKVIVARMIWEAVEKGKGPTWFDLVSRLLMMLIVGIGILAPVVLKVILPFWVEVFKR